MVVLGSILHTLRGFNLTVLLTASAALFRVWDLHFNICSRYYFGKSESFDQSLRVGDILR